MTRAGVKQELLVVDDNDEHRFLLVKTLLRKFPNAFVHECADEGKAISLMDSAKLAAVVLHRSLGLRGIDLTRELRRRDARIPIVLVSGVDRSADAIGAGATAFLHYDEWLRVGTLVAELIEATEPLPETPDRGTF